MPTFIPRESHSSFGSWGSADMLEVLDISTVLCPSFTPLVPALFLSLPLRAAKTLPFSHHFFRSRVLSPHTSRTGACVLLHSVELPLLPAEIRRRLPALSDVICSSIFRTFPHQSSGVLTPPFAAVLLPLD